MNKKIIFILLIVFGLLLLTGGVFYYQKYYKNLKSVNTSVVAEKSSDFAKRTTDTSTKEKILIYQKNDQGNQVLLYDPVVKETKKIFSDQNEDLKINMLGGYAYLKDELLIYVGTDNSGKLELINLGDGTKKLINDSFAKPLALSISPDGSLIFYVTASSSDVNGATIYQMAQDGTNKRQLLQSDKIVTNLAVSENSDKIAYIASQNANKSSLNVLDINSLKNNEIYTSVNQILSLQYHPDGKIVFSEGLANQIKTGRAMVIDDDGSALMKIFQTKKDFPYSITVSDDFITSAFVLTEYKDKFESSLSGEADFINVGDESINKIGSGSFIIGFKQ